MARRAARRIRARRSAELDAVLLGIGQRLRRQAGDHGAAFADRAGHQVPGKRRRHQRADRDRSGRFAGDGDARGIAAEGRDVLLHPAQRGHLVEQAVVARGVVRRFLGQFGMDEEAENVGPVVDGYGDHAFARHALAVVARLRAVAVLEAAAENVDQNGEFLLDPISRESRR